MIEKISVKNFKSHAHTEIELGRVTALVGPNGCGKTSLLQAILLPSKLLDEAWGELRNEFHPNNLVAANAIDAEVSLEGQLRTHIGNSGKNTWEVHLGLSSQNMLRENCELLVWDNRDKKNVKEIPSGELLRNVLDSKLVFNLSGINYFKPSFSKLSLPSYSEKIPPVIESDGGGLASAAAYLMTSERDRHEQIEASLRSIVPIIKRVRAKPAKVQLSEKKVLAVNDTRVPYEETREVTGQELVFDTTGGGSLPAYAMSEGTLLVFCLLTLLYSPSCPQMILLDDIEQGLHPLAQRQLMTTLKEFAEKHGRQIVLTSHSPYIIDELEAEEVWVMATDKGGISRSERLSDHPDAKRLLEVLTTGEFVGAVGEDWVIPNESLTEVVNA